MMTIPGTMASCAYSGEATGPRKVDCNLDFWATFPRKSFPNQMGVEPKIVGFSPKMDGENFMENPMNKWMIWGETPLFLETPRCIFCWNIFRYFCHEK